MGYRISDFERAIRGREDIEFDEIYLKGGYVDVVIGKVREQMKRKVRGSVRVRSRRVRWNCDGVCLDICGKHLDNLNQFNIKL
jgi:hypothetical protein